MICWQRPPLSAFVEGRERGLRWWRYDSVAESFVKTSAQGLLITAVKCECTCLIKMKYR